MTWFWVGVVFMLAIAAGVAAFLIIRDDQSKSPSTTTSTARHLSLDRDGNRATGGGARLA